jgi:uncharacterized protein YjiS (DUF1127 family)
VPSRDHITVTTGSRSRLEARLRRTLRRQIPTRRKRRALADATFVYVDDLPIATGDVREVFVRSSNRPPTLDPSRWASGAVARLDVHATGEALAKGRTLEVIARDFFGREDVLAVLVFHMEDHGELHITSLEFADDVTRYRTPTLVRLLDCLGQVAVQSAALGSRSSAEIVWDVTGAQERSDAFRAVRDLFSRGQPVQNGRRYVRRVS